MQWTELSITVNHEVVPIVTNILEEHGSNGVVIEDAKDLTAEHEDKFGEIYNLKAEDYPEQGVRIKSYFSELSYNDELKAEIQRQINEIEHIDMSVLHFEEIILEESDWENEWKNYFHPFKASRRFTIVPSWETYQTTDSEALCIELDPGMAFGTGDHPTTSMCLKAIESYVKPTDHVIDVGTGSGILSIAAYLLGSRHIKALDLDEMAVNVAKENFEKNHCLETIHAVPGNLLVGETGRYHVVVANILAHIIEQMIDDAYHVLEPGGYFITSGIIEEKGDEIKAQMERAGFTIVEQMFDNSWTCIVGQKEGDV